jgi:nitroreductase
MRSVIQVIRDRRSQKTFTNRPVNEADIRTLLDAAVLAPNHKLTQPWGFIVLGPRARRRYGEIKAHLRVREETDPVVAEEKRAKIAAEIAAVPAVVVVTQRVEGEPNRRREDYAAIFMAIENMLLAATSMGLGSKVHTGDIMNAVPMRELVKAEEHEQIVAIVHLGEAAEEMKPKARSAASEKTRWLP